MSLFDHLTFSLLVLNSPQIIVVHYWPIYIWNNFVPLGIYDLLLRWLIYLMFVSFQNPFRMCSIYCQISMWLTWSRLFRVSLQCHFYFAGVAGVFICFALFMDCWFMPLICSKNKWYDVGYLSFFRDPKRNCSPQLDQQQGEIQFLNLHSDMLF
jgi:hypothetical protein